MDILNHHADEVVAEIAKAASAEQIQPEAASEEATNQQQSKSDSALVSDNIAASQSASHVSIDDIKDLPESCMIINAEVMIAESVQALAEATNNESLEQEQAASEPVQEEEAEAEQAQENGEEQAEEVSGEAQEEAPEQAEKTSAEVQEEAQEEALNEAEQEAAE